MENLARRVDTTAWSCIVLAVVCFLLTGLEIAIPPLLARITESIGAGDDPSLAATRRAFVEGAAGSALVNAALGAGLLCVGIGIARRSSWAHRAGTIAAWTSIAALLAVIRPSVSPLLAMYGEARGARIAILACSGVLFAAQAALVIAFLRFWRRPAVAALFDASQRGR
ncbi:MAG TPA: hypothetical protein VMR65_02820 [Candidatus Sulfotelmatobacter sp.]|jgi:hypothetical protein|nr:hypothetical protein [Candidatus Sulfotelmatobacter sp.]